MQFTDTPSPSGWIRLYGVRVAKALVIGAVGAAAALNINGHVNYTQTGSETGAILQVNGVSRFQRFTVPCTATGGTNGVGGYYATCLARSPLTTTGVLLGVSVECGNVPQPYAFSGGFVKARANVVGVSFKNFAAAGAGTGKLAAVHSTGAYLWNPADLIKINTATAVRAASGDNCVLGLDTFDKYGS